MRIRLKPGFVPAVIYSHDEAPVSLKVSERDINTVLSHAVGEHLLVDLEIADGANRLALIQEVQHHPLTQKVLPVDFHGVSANEAIESSVPLEAIGDAAGVKNGRAFCVTQLFRFPNTGWRNTPGRP